MEACVRNGEYGWCSIRTWAVDGEVGLGDHWFCDRCVSRSAISSGAAIGTEFGTVLRMAALNVPFDDAELAGIRIAAQEADQSLQDFVHDAAVERADRNKQQVAAAAQLVAQRSAELNRRLRDK